MQGMVAGKRSRGKPRQRWEKDITDTFGTMAAASRVTEDRHQFRRDIMSSDALTRICSEKKRITQKRDRIIHIIFSTHLIFTQNQQQTDINCWLLEDTSLGTVITA